MSDTEDARVEEARQAERSRCIRLVMSLAPASSWRNRLVEAIKAEGATVPEKRERNEAIVAAVRAGESRSAVALQYGISRERVKQIVAAAEARERRRW